MPRKKEDIIKELCLIKGGSLSKLEASGLVRLECLRIRVIERLILYEMCFIRTATLYTQGVSVHRF